MEAGDSESQPGSETRSTSSPADLTRRIADLEDDVRWLRENVQQAIDDLNAGRTTYALDALAAGLAGIRATYW